ncbi:hypothetical protein CMV_023149 [Castanea mollissima]|uniref:Secreted protein n=1 Tax=Castanea mollissima TaxID=60419 RepID=A0A8J4QKV0_9ROSI|nr:hypothetical protein CMV_023149 [Castanea mollissima]
MNPPALLFCPTVFCFSLIPTLEFMYMNAWIHCNNPLAETLANGSPGQLGSSGHVANYIGKLGTLEGFLRQAISLCTSCNK